MGEEAGFMMDEGNEGAETEAPHKVYRHRKKQLYQSIRKQMEFYFSDSNLTKDRFLGNLLKEDPCIDLSVFIRFNRIRALTTDISDIAKALRHSELLSVTEDGTKVLRTKPVQWKENIDDCTIYVEQLPPDADHDWVRDVFSAYGNVAYVSIPKYRTSGKIKGFGFVEFETPEEANKTLEAFGARGCRLSSEIAPDKLCSISTFEGDETSNVDEKNQGELSEKEVKKEQTAEKDSSQHKRKRRSSHRESIKDTDNEHASENEAKSTQSKGQDLSEEDVKGSTKEEEDSKEGNHDHKRKSAKNQEQKAKFVEKDENEKPDESSSDTKRKRKKLSEGDIEDEETDPDASKKCRKLTEQYTGEVKIEESPKKKRKKKQEDDTLEEEEEGEDSVASKRIKTETTENEDVAPENVQLDQQVKKKRRRETEEETRENTAEEDEQVSESRSHYVTEECEIENIEGESKRKRKRKKKKKNKQDKQDVSLQILSKREWKRLRNKYLDLQRAKMKCLKQYLSKQYWSNQMQQGNTDTPEPEVKVSQPRITYTPGVIVYAILDEPITDIRKFKADTKALQDVEYVDVLPGANTAYIRCSTADGAKQLASSNPWVSGVVLKGEEETEYWDKIMADRKVKFSNKIRTKQRGRDKVLRRAERELGKHIKFDE